MTRDRFVKTGLLCVTVLTSLVLFGCSGKGSDEHDKRGPVAEEKIKAARGKLAPEDRTLVDQQEWCAVAVDQRLGAMGKPYKVSVRGQTVFLCCSHCEKKALADPDKTLATVQKNQERARDGRDGKGK